MYAIIALINVNKFTLALFTAMFLYLMIISSDSKFPLRCASSTDPKLLYLYTNRKLLASSVDKGWSLHCTMLNCRWPCDPSKNPQ